MTGLSNKYGCKTHSSAHLGVCDVRNQSCLEACSESMSINTYLINIENSVEGCKRVADGKEGDEHQQAVIDQQCEWQLGAKHCCHICSPHSWPKVPCHAVQHDQEIVCLCDAPVFVAIKQHTCTNHGRSAALPRLHMRL